jgi:hypothetical protein
MLNGIASCRTGLVIATPELPAAAGLDPAVCAPAAHVSSAIVTAIRIETLAPLNALLHS